ncbi:hypothetical protein [Mesorhizobium amorphae]|uniref:hypothetical protein n=1 Tax=Mesorhizobium amorphae TaxID=71433 RepID=UPI0024E06CC0|nr:hypothetical protein [Mesorhizobium amorphae]
MTGRQVPALIFAFVRHDHNRQSDDGGIGELQLDGFRHEELPYRHGAAMQSLMARSATASGQEWQEA